MRIAQAVDDVAIDLVVLIVADVALFVAFGRYLVTRLVTGPMDRLVEATQAVADGELGRRAPAAGTREFDRLAASVNRMTERLLDAQGLLVRAEKLASVGRLAAGVAHEVGNPLSAIDNYLEVLRRRGAEPELVAAIGREADGAHAGKLEHRVQGAHGRERLHAGRLPRNERVPHELHGQPATPIHRMHHHTRDALHLAVEPGAGARAVRRSAGVIARLTCCACVLCMRDRAPGMHIVIHSHLL